MDAESVCKYICDINAQQSVLYDQDFLPVEISVTVVTNFTF